MVAFRVQCQTGEEYTGYYCTHCRKHHTGHKPDWMLRNEGAMVNMGDVARLASAEKDERIARERLNKLIADRNILNDEIRDADGDVRVATTRARELQRRACRMEGGDTKRPFSAVDTNTQQGR